MSEVKVLGFAGSLRRESWNAKVLAAAAGLAPDGMAIETFDLSPIPLYNEDVKKQGFPGAVQAFRERIAAADALLIATPEYNHSIPGVLKNAIDWASRPPDQPFDGKPVAFLGATPGRAGTVRAQRHLRHVCVFLNLHPVNRPEILIGQVDKKFDGDGNLSDETTRDLIRALLSNLADWTMLLRRGRGEA